jgi:transcription factor E
MQVKFLKSIVETLVGKQAVPIIDLLTGKEHVNEFLIAKKLALTINQTRNILYKLFDYGLVSFIRKKDKKKGWYIYFWTLNIYQSLNLLEQTLRKELESLEIQLKNRKEKRYYSCNTCSIEVTEETALLNDFVCSECEEVYELSKNEELIKDLESKIGKIKKEIEMVALERMEEGGKLEKKKERKIKSAERKRKNIRDEKRNVKKAEKKKLNIKTTPNKKKNSSFKKSPHQKPAKKITSKKKKKI